MPSVLDLQFDGRLTDIAVQYKNPQYIADMVLPPRRTPTKKVTYKKYDKNSRFTVPPSLVGPKGWPNEVEWSTTDDTATCLDYGYQEFLSQEEIDNAQTPITAQADTVEFVANLLMLDREIRTAAAVFDAANYDAANEVDIAGAWNTLSSSTVLTDIETGIDACFMPPNVLVMGIATWRKASRSAELLAAVKGTLAPQTITTGGPGKMPSVTSQELASYLGLDAVLIGTARKNTAVAGQTATFARVWADIVGATTNRGAAALLRVTGPGIGLKDVTSFAAFDWKGRQVMTSETDRGAFGGQNIRVVESTVIKTVSTDVGYLLKDCLVT
jgi:hypothetical protein